MVAGSVSRTYTGLGGNTPRKQKGDRTSNASILSQVPHEARHAEPNPGHDEEREIGHQGQLPGLQYRDVSHREELGPGS